MKKFRGDISQRGRARDRAHRWPTRWWEAIGRSDGTGNFWIQVPGGIRCEGAYDPYDPSPG
jgi:hypothetical protein